MPGRPPGARQPPTPSGRAPRSCLSSVPSSRSLLSAAPRRHADEALLRSAATRGPRALNRLGGFAHRLDLTGLGKAVEPLLLELLHLAGLELEPAAGLTQGRGLVAVDPVAQLDDPALVIR